MNYKLIVEHCNSSYCSGIPLKFDMCSCNSGFKHQDKKTLKKKKADCSISMVGIRLLLPYTVGHIKSNLIINSWKFNSRKWRDIFLSFSSVFKRYFEGILLKFCILVYYLEVILLLNISSWYQDGFHIYTSFCRTSLRAF